MVPLLLLLLGHQFAHPKVMRIGFKQDVMLLAINYDINPGRDARQIRALFDRNTDQTLSEKEREGLVRYLKQMATLFLKVEVGGQPVTPQPVSVTDVRADLPTSASDSLGIALLLRVDLPATDVRIRVSDRTKDKQKHVPVVVDLTDSWSVAFSSQGELFGSPATLRRIRLAADRDLRLHLRRRSAGRP